MALLVKNGTVLLESGICVKDIRIEDGVFTQIDKNLLETSDDEVIDATGKYILPGLIDAHVHYKMGLGNLYTIDNFETGSRAALFGGVTTVVDYAEPVAGQDLTYSLNVRLAEAKNASYVDYTMHMVIDPTVELTKENFKALRESGVNSVKLFTIYDQQLSYEDMEKIMGFCAELDMVVTVHAEDHQIVEDKIDQLVSEGKTSPRYHGESRPASAEIVAVEKMIEMSRKTGAHVHIVHVSAGLSAEAIRKAQDKGVNITAETCPHYLALDDSVYERDDAQLFIMQPPLRGKKDIELLWENVKAGTFSFFTTDHCAYCKGQKYDSDTFFDTNGGIPGTETMFPLLHTQGVKEGRISLKVLVDMLSVNPAKMFGIYPQKGTIKVGSDADMVIFDDQKKLTITNELVHTAAQYSPFEGIALEGYPEMTFLRGKLMCRDGSFVGGDPEGDFIKAEES